MLDPSDTLKKNPIFKDLNEKQIEHLISSSEEISLKAGDYLMLEGDLAKDIFIIVEGELEILKIDPSTKQNFSLGKLHSGDTVGEMALVDHGLRSASLKAASTTSVRSFPIDALEKLVKKDPSFLSVYQNLAQNISKKLRFTTEVTVEALKNQLLELQNRADMGSFLIVIIVMLSLISFSIIPLEGAIKAASSSTMISIPVIILFTMLVLTFMYYSKLPKETFGLAFKNNKRSIYEGIVYSIPVAIITMLLKLLMIYSLPFYSHHELFEPFALTPDPSFQTLHHWLLINFVYCLFVPAQELLARGALQGPLENFLTGKSKIILSILASNLIFSTAHIYLSFWVAFVAFIGGLFQGWLFSRTHNLIGVTISHSMLGVWTLAVLGP